MATSEVGGKKWVGHSFDGGIPDMENADYCRKRWQVAALHRSPPKYSIMLYLKYSQLKFNFISQAGVIIWLCLGGQSRSSGCGQSDRTYHIT